MARGDAYRISGVARIPPGPLKHPSLDIAIEINRSVRESGEHFEERDDLERVQRVLELTQGFTDPVEVAALLAYRITHAQGFAEGNKRTALLLARWVLDRNGIEGSKLIPSDDRELARLLIEAASGLDVEQKTVALFRERVQSYER